MQQQQVCQVHGGDELKQRLIDGFDQSVISVRKYEILSI